MDEFLNQLGVRPLYRGFATTEEGLARMRRHLGRGGGPGWANPRYPWEPLPSVELTGLPVVVCDDIDDMPHGYVWLEVK